MLFVEFIAPIRNSTQSLQCLSALYYLKHNLQVEVAPIKQIENLLVERGRVHKRGTVNYPRALEHLKEYVDSPSKGMWQITPSGETRIRTLLNLPPEEIGSENDTTTLEGVVTAKIDDVLTAEYFKEGIDCLNIGRLRAAVVFIWSGVIYLIRQRLIKKKLTDLNATLRKYDPKARTIKKIDDFSYIKDSVLLLATQDLGLFDKSQREVLEEDLDLRNKCGHPAKYSPGPKRVSAFIEDVVNIIFP